MIDAYAQLGNARKCEELLRRMISMDVTPSEVSYSCVLAEKGLKSRRER